MICIIQLLKIEIRKQLADDQYDNNENDYNNFDDFITPNHYIGTKNNNEILK